MAVLTATTGLCGSLVLWLVPAAPGHVLLALELVLAAMAALVWWRRDWAPLTLTLCHRGHVEARQGRRHSSARLLPGGVLAPGFAWLRVQIPGESARWRLFLAPENEDSWRLAALIWRWGQPPAPAADRVNS